VPGLCVPGLKRNLFSVGAMGKTFLFHDYSDCCKVRERNGTLSAQRVRHGRLYRMLSDVKIQKSAMWCNITH